jgi:hypothetical protein
MICFNDGCGEAGKVCEETVAEWFAKHQAPAFNRTCLQCSPLQFSHRQVLKFKLAFHAPIPTFSKFFNFSSIE